MAHAAEEKLAPVGAGFINRTIVGGTAAALLKGAVWGNAVALSQALGAFVRRPASTLIMAGRFLNIHTCD
jgi:hypothetical protein